MNIEKFLSAYLECAAWSITSEDGEPIEGEFAPEAVEQARKDCAAFIQAAGDLLADWSEEQAGHDFWLTRCGHGAGFWDRGLPAGDALSELCGFRKAFDNLDLYAGDDGMLYFG